MKIRRVILLTCILLSTILFTNGVRIIMFINNIDKNNIDKNNIIKKDDNYEFTKLNGESSISYDKSINLLVLGLDEEGVRSDVILLLNYSPEDSRLSILSIARDTMVNIKGRRSKMNAAVAIGGERLIINMMEKLTDLPIDFYFTMNLSAFRKIVDELGGVEVNVPFNMNYDDPHQNLHIHLMKGRQVLNGEKAEGFIRYRKGNKRGQGYKDGDIGRIKAQQEFLKALIQQKLKLRYISKVDDILEILQDNVKTNIKVSDIKYYGKSFMNLKQDDIKTFTLPGYDTYIDGISYFVCNKEETKNLIEDNFSR